MSFHEYSIVIADAPSLPSAPPQPSAGAPSAPLASTETAPPFSTEALAKIPPESWLTAIAIMGASFVVLLAMHWLAPRLAKRAAGTPGRVDDWIVEILRRTNIVFILVVALFLGSLAVPLPPTEAEWVRIVMVTALLIQVGHWINTTLNFCFVWHPSEPVDRERAMTLQFLAFLGKVALWATILLLVLSNLGVNVTALITGLGIGGVAVALALQNLLGDLFASLALLLDKPFIVGEFIVSGDTVGTVERIGLKTTRIRALQGEEIVVPNADLMRTRIQNFGRMQKRRVVFTFGVNYSTAPDKLDRVQKIVRDILAETKNAQLDRVNLQAFGAAALEFEVVYFVLSADYNVHMDIRHKIYVELLRRLAAERIELTALGIALPPRA